MDQFVPQKDSECEKEELQKEPEDNEHEKELQKNLRTVNMKKKNCRRNLVLPYTCTA